jgi:hypothetical protein
MDFSATQQEGFLFCNAFNALDYSALGEVPRVREPSASVRAK